MPGTVVLSSPRWHLSGVNTCHASLARGLLELGYDVEILLTSASLDECEQTADATGLPVHGLPVPPSDSWPRRWRALAEYLTVRAPCVYLPGYDFDSASICPALPPGVGIVGVLHSDESHYFAFAQRVGGSWNGLVGVSRFLADRATTTFPRWRDRVRHIPYGVEIPPACPPRRAHGEPLRVVMIGRISQAQKRVFDLLPLAHELERRLAAVQITVVGGGQDEVALRLACAEFGDAGRVRFAGNLPHERALALLDTQDVLLLLSAYEGLPLVLLEAMGRGCIPVVTDIRSGIPDVVAHGHNGMRLPVGDMPAFAAALDELQRDAPRRIQLAQAAHATVHRGGYRIADMAGAYAALLESVLTEARAGRSPGRTRRIAPPRHLRAWSRWRMAMTGGMRRWLAASANPAE